MTTDDNDFGLSAEEQAQFDSMRDNFSPGSNADSPEQLVTDDPPVLEADQVTPPADAPEAPALEPHDDEDVEIVKDASGKDVIDGKTGKPQKRVSFHKFQRTANRVAELEKQLAQTAEERARIDERLNIINEALLAKPAAEAPPAEQTDEDPEPDIEQNIFEHAKWMRRQLDSRTQQFTQVIDNLQAKLDERDLGDAYRQDASRFASQEPQFGEAYKHLINTRMAQLRAAGWTDEQKIVDQVTKEERGLVRNALTARQSPSARIFAMAKAQGFTPKAAPQAAPAPAAPRPAAAAAPAGGLDGPIPARPAPAPQAAPRVPSVSEQVALAQKGAEAAMSLSNAGGGATEPLTAAKLLAMDEAEFNAVVSSLPNAKLRELFGD